MTRARRLAATLARRPVLAAALIYALLALAFVGPALVPGRVLSNSDSFWYQPPWLGVKPASLMRPANPEVDDAPAVLQPFTQYAKARLPDVPLWNPHLMGGRPFLADAQSAVFSPFTLPAYVLPFYSALAWIAALKLFAAALGTFLLGRALGMRFAGALLAGVVYGFNLWLVTWLAYPHASVWAVLPWLLVLADRVVRHPGPLAAGGLAAVGGLQFLAGHPESSFHALLTTVCFFALRLWGRRRDTPRGERSALRVPLFAFGAALVGGAALAALVLVPFGELLLHSADLRQRAGSALGAHLPLRDLAEVFLPDYWGRPTQTPLELFLLARAFYAGALPLMLAGTALLLRPTRDRVAVALYGLAAMAVVVGIPPVFQLVTHLPVFSSGHNGRLVVLAMLCVALLAGWGLDELTAEVRRRAPRLGWALGLSVALLLAPVLFIVLGGKSSLRLLGDALDVAWGLATPPPATDPDASGTIRLAALVVWVTVAGAGLLLLAAWARGRLPPRAFAVLALGLVVLDLFRAGMGNNPAIARRAATQPATGAIRYLAARRPARFVSTARVPQDAIPMRFGLYEARGYDLPVERRYDRLWRREVSPELPSQVGAYPGNIPLSLPRLDPRRLRTLSLLGVTDVLQPADEPPLRVAGLSLAYAGPDARVYRNAGALPRAWVAGAQLPVAGGEAALDAITRPGFDARGVAVTERPLPGLPVASRAPGAGRAAILRYAPERVVVGAWVARPGLLVLSDNDFPGWHASVDGRRAPVERVDYVFRGVRLGPGAHRVELSYAPASWRLGWIVSAVSLLVLLAVLAVGWRRARRSAGSGSGSGSEPTVSR